MNGNVPTCFADEWQFIHWVEADKTVRRSIGKEDATYNPFPCVSCTPSYAASMRMANKCDRPEVKFKFDEAEGEFIGYDPAKGVPSGGRPWKPRGAEGPVIKSKYPGLSWDRKLNKWQVRIWIGRKSVSLGYYADEEEAHIVQRDNVDRVKAEHKVAA